MGLLNQDFDAIAPKPIVDVDAPKRVLNAQKTPGPTGVGTTPTPASQVQGTYGSSTDTNLVNRLGGNTVTGGLNTPEPSKLYQSQPGQIVNPMSGPQANQTLYNYTRRSDLTPGDFSLVPPNLRTIDPESETVQGQLAGIMKSDSPLMQLAQRQGLEQAQRRGLLNTSLAAESAQVGMMREAMPVAQQDAAAYLKQGMTNQQYENQFLGNVQQTGLQNWMAAQGDERKLNEMQKQFELDRQMMTDEYGFKAEETAGKQNAALWAQFIQAAGDINQADMSLKAKEQQIEALKQATLSGMAYNSKQFNDPQMYDWLVGQMNNVNKAVQGATAAVTPQMASSAAKTYTLPERDTSGRLGGINFGDGASGTYQVGQTLPYGYVWGTDPATGLFGIIRA